MKKKIFFYGILTLLANVSLAQVKTLQIGDQLPDMPLGEMLNAEKANMTTADLKGKLVLVDFWATWCGPCVAIIPKLDTLEKKFGGKLVVLKVTDENAEKVNALFKRLPLNVKKTSVINDVTWRRMFRHNSIPHFAWINSSGKVIAVTGNEEVTEKNILNAIRDQDAHLTQKKDVFNKYVFVKGSAVYPSLLLDKNNGDSLVSIKDKVFLNSTLSAAIPGLGLGGTYCDTNIIECENITLSWLYRMAFWGDSFKKMSEAFTITEVNDPDLREKITSEKAEGKPRFGPEFDEFIKEYGYCYELTVPPALIKEKFNIMLTTLNAYFGNKYGIIGVKETRRIKSHILRKVAESEILPTKGGEVKRIINPKYLLMNNVNPAALFQVFTTTLQLAGSLEYDLTGMGNIDIELNCKLTDLDSVNQELKKYGLQFVTVEKDDEVGIIKKIKSI